MTKVTLFLTLTIPFPRIFPGATASIGERRIADDIVTNSTKNVSTKGTATFINKKSNFTNNAHEICLTE